ncbi:MAG: phosphonate ABC transporter, permease protein PhnE [Bdellovibrionales bacterium RBG_16_40_8]|nr:MAG: phosphonate ABC transporter, permease protein PhnE [Bdellovibrionales bacterium RBG_16_40_8]
MTFGYLILVTIWYTILSAESANEEALLNLKQILAAIVIPIIFGGILTYLLHKNNVTTLGLHIFEPKYIKLQKPPTSWHKTFWGWQLLITFLITFIIGLHVTEFSFYELTDESGFHGAKRIFSALLSPEHAILPKGIISIIETIYIAFMATIVAIPFAFVFSFFSAKNIMGNSPLTLAIYFLLRTLMNITRSIEPLIWAIIFSVWVGIGPFAGMLALLLHSIASLTKQYSEIIESAEDGPIEGILATGANSAQVVWYAIVPQVLLPYIAFTVYRWDINVRMATIIGLVGGGGIGTLLIQYQGQAMWNEVGTLALLIILVVWTMDTFSAYIREALK